MKVTAETITDEQIRSLGLLAVEDGNRELAAVCCIALLPNEPPVRRLAREEIASAWNARNGGADRQERSRLHGLMRDQAHALADAKGQLRAANERVDHLCAAIAPCQGDCGDDCRQKRLCDLARRYVNPTAMRGASAEFVASLRRAGVL